MSEEVEKVLHGYLAVVQHKDNEIFRLHAENLRLRDDVNRSIRETEEMRERLAENEEAISVARASLHERHESIRAMDEELRSLRGFVQFVRRQLFCDDERSTIRDVMQTLSDRLDSYAARSLEWQRRIDRDEEARKSIAAAMTEIEREYRATLSQIAEESQFTLLGLSDEVRRIMEIYIKERSSREKLATDMQQQHAEAVVAEVNRLQEHVNDLMEENERLKGVAQRQQAELFIARDSAQIESRGSKMVAHWAADYLCEISELALAGRSSLLQAGHHAASLLRELLEEKSAARALMVVNEGLREQVRNTAKELHQWKMKEKKLKESSIAESSRLLEESKERHQDLRARLADTMNRERELDQLLQRSKLRVAELVEQLDMAAKDNAVMRENQKRMERTLDHKNHELAELKKILQSLQEKSGRVRGLLADQEQENVHLQRHNERHIEEKQLLESQLVAIRLETDSLRRDLEEARRLTQSTQEAAAADMQRLLERYQAEKRLHVEETAAAQAAVHGTQQRLSELTLKHLQELRERDVKIEELQTNFRSLSTSLAQEQQRLSAHREQSQIEIELLNALLQKEQEKCKELTQKLRAGDPVALRSENERMRKQINDLELACEMSVRSVAALREACAEKQLS
jgi:chromosome segregation ATPase